MDTALIVKLLGSLTLGLFVGVVLALCIRGKKTITSVQVKSAKFVIGAALSGAPVLFMRDLGFEKWMYPVGLIFGLLILRLIAARNILSSSSNDSEHSQLAKAFAWVDMLGIAGVLAAVILCILFFTGPASPEPLKTKPSVEVGNDSVGIGRVSGSIGDRSVVIGATDSNGNTIITQPMAVGYNAQAGPGSIAIGANARAGVPLATNQEPRATKEAK